MRRIFTISEQFQKLAKGYLDPFWVMRHYTEKSLPENTVTAWDALLAMSED